MHEDRREQGGGGGDSAQSASGPSPRPHRLGAVALLLAASVFLSRVMGYLRDAALANQVGAGSETDAYYAAFQIPDLLNYLLAGGALSIAFLPFYTRVRRRDGPAAAEQLLSTVLGTLGLACIAATLALWIAADELVAFQFRHFDEQTQLLTVKLTRIVLPAQIFFVTGGVVRAVLMADGRFAAHALAPLLYNGCIIAGGIVSGRAEGFAWGVLVGAVLGPWLVPLIDLTRRQRLRVRVAPLDPGLRSYLWLALPLMIGLSLATVDEWYERWFGATLAAGTVAQLGFARKLMQAPVAVVGQAVATAALPALSDLFARGRHEELDRTLLRTLQGSLALAVLAGAACGLFARPLVEILYRHGRFSSSDAAGVASILSVLALGVPAWVTQQVAVRAFYAREDTWRPMLLGTAMALLAIPLYRLLMLRWGSQGLAAAGVIAMTANATATLAWARWRHGAPDLGALLATFARAAVIALGAALPAALCAAQFASDGFAGSLLELAVCGSVFAGAAILGVRVVGDDASREALRRLSARLRPTGGST